MGADPHRRPRKSKNDKHVCGVTNQVEKTEIQASILYFSWLQQRPYPAGMEKFWKHVIGSFYY